jgi:hypothetical protein
VLYTLTLLESYLTYVSARALTEPSGTHAIEIIQNNVSRLLHLIDACKKLLTVCALVAPDELWTMEELFKSEIAKIENRPADPHPFYLLCLDRPPPSRTRAQVRRALCPSSGSALCRCGGRAHLISRYLASGSRGSGVEYSLSLVSVPRRRGNGSERHRPTSLYLAETETS